MLARPFFFSFLSLLKLKEHRSGNELTAEGLSLHGAWIITAGNRGAKFMIRLPAPSSCAGVWSNLLPARDCRRGANVCIRIWAGLSACPKRNGLFQRTTHRAQKPWMGFVSSAGCRVPFPIHSRRAKDTGGQAIGLLRVPTPPSERKTPGRLCPLPSSPPSRLVPDDPDNQRAAQFECPRTL